MTGTVRGADPAALREYAGWCEQVAAAADGLAGELRNLVSHRCPIWGPFGEQLANQLSTHDIAWLNYGAERLRELARTVRANAEQQEVASAGTAPERPPSGGSGWDTVVGVLQLVGGAVEVVGGVALLATPEPTMLTKAAGGVSLVHGTDTFLAGWRTLWHGKAQESYTAQGATVAAEWAGVPEDKARWVGVGVDVGAGLGPGLATRFTQRAAIAAGQAEAAIAAEAGVIARTTGANLDEATELARAAYVAENGDSALHVGVLSGHGSGMANSGHNVVGVTTADGSTKFFHLVPTSMRGVGWYPHFGSTIASLEGKGYHIATVPVRAAEADAALNHALTLGKSVNGQPWSRLGPNCSTTVADVVEAGGQSIVHAGPLTPRATFEAFKYPYAAPGNAVIGGSHIATPGRAVAGASDPE